jgi:hypothetical protein
MLPNRRNKILSKLRQAMSNIADELLARTRAEKEGIVSEEKAEEKSIIGLLSKSHNLALIFHSNSYCTVKAESSSTELQMSQEEVAAQVRLKSITYDYELTSS